MTSMEARALRSPGATDTTGMEPKIGQAISGILPLLEFGTQGCETCCLLIMHWVPHKSFATYPARFWYLAPAKPLYKIFV